MTKFWIYYQNCNSLRSPERAAEFKSNLMKVRKIYKVICLTETNLYDESDDESLFDTQKYFVFRRDRDSLIMHKSKNGGVLIAVRKDMFDIVQRQEDLETLLEDLWVSITHNDVTVSICCTYDNTFLSRKVFREHLFRVYQKCNTRRIDDVVIILGDYNRPTQKYFDDTIEYARLNYCRHSTDIMPLDLIFSTEANRVAEETNGLINEETNHPALLINFENVFERNKQTLNRFIREMADNSRLYRTFERRALRMRMHALTLNNDSE